MKRYKLKYDLPTFNAGDLFFLSESGNLIAGTPEKPVTIDIGPMEVDLVAYSRQTLEKFPNILHTWFEEIKDKPKYYWFVRSSGEIDCAMVDENDDTYLYRKSRGNTYDNLLDAVKAEDRVREAVRIIERAKNPIIP